MVSPIILCTFARKKINCTNMKKIFLMVVAAMMATVNVNAQDEKNEVGVFYGVESASNILSVFTSAFSAAAGDQSSWWGPIGAEYYYHLTPGVAVGGVLAYASCKAEDDKTKQKDLSETFITVMPSVKFNWLRKNNWGLYSTLCWCDVRLCLCRGRCEDCRPECQGRDRHPFYVPGHSLRS